MGSVYHAHDRVRDEPVAVKIVRFIADGTPIGERIRAFETEIRFAARLSHPRIVRIFDAGLTAEGQPFYAMELIKGVPLTPMRQTPAPWPVLSDIFDQILDGLGYAHARGVIHRDIKPDNILLKPRGDGGHDVVLTDLGLAYLREERWDSGESVPKLEVFGTPRYMAPEQLQQSSRDIGPWTDLYAVGGVLYELLAGAAAFEGAPIKIAMTKLSREAPPLVLRPDYDAPPGIEEIVARLLERDIWRRFELAADVRAALKSLPDVPQLKGRPRPILPPLPAEPTREQNPPRPALSLFSAREPVFVGRDALKRHLWEKAHEAIQKREPRVILVEGEAGAGKSRLCRWLAESLEGLGMMRAIKVREAEAGAFAGFAGAVQRHLRTSRLEGEELVGRLASYLRSHGEQGNSERHVLGRWLAPASPEDVVSGGERDTLFVDFLRREAWRGGVFLWIDDVALSHPSEGLSFLERLVSDPELSAGLPCLVVATYRKESLIGRPQLSPIRTRLALNPWVTERTVERLSPEESFRLVDHLLLLSPEIVQSISDRAEGNPLYAVMLLSHWVNEGYFEEGEDGVARPRAGVNLSAALPQDIEALFTARVDAALARNKDAEAARLVLYSASFLGDEFALDAHEEALQGMLPAARTREVLKGLWSEGLLKRGIRPGRFRFDHPLLCATLRAQAERHHAARALHVGAAFALKKRALEADEHLEAARHFEAAHESEAAATAYLAAGERVSQTDIPHAEELYRHAKGLIDASPLEAQEKLLPRYLLNLGNVMRRQNNLEEAKDLLQNALSLLEQHPEDDRVTRAQTLRGIALIAMSRGELAEAQALFEEAQLAAQGDEATEAEVACGLGIVLNLRGEIDAAAERFEASRFLARVAKERRTETRALLRLAYAQLSRGVPERAQPLLEEAQQLAQTIGDRTLEYTVKNVQAEFFRAQGDNAGAEECLRECLRLSRAAGFPQGTMIARYNLAFLALSRGEPDAALHQLNQAHPTLPPGHFWLRAVGALYRAWAAALKGDIDGARARLEESMALGLDRYREPDIARAAEGLYEAAKRLPDPPTAREAFAIARAQYLALGRTADAERLATHRRPPRIERAEE